MNINLCYILKNCGFSFHTCLSYGNLIFTQLEFINIFAPKFLLYSFIVDS